MQDSTLTSADSAARLLRFTDAWARLKTCLSLLFTAASLRLSQSPWNTHQESCAFRKNKQKSPFKNLMRFTNDGSVPLEPHLIMTFSISSGLMCKRTCIKLGVSCKSESRWCTPQEISTSPFTSFICKASCANNTQTNITYSYRQNKGWTMRQKGIRYCKT